MRIDSGTIGMDSARAYTTTTQARSFSLSVSSVPKADAKLSLKEQIENLREEYINLLIRLLFPERALSINGGVIRQSEHGGINGFLGMQGNSGSLGDSQPLYYSQEYYYEENEYTSFNAQGTVKTKDGREINFGINLEMSRSFMEYYSEEVSNMADALMDPLVINFDTDIADLEDQTFMFDIDSDGVMDEMSRLSRGSGFLALDLNSDGIINDGNELFGTQSGNGFKDLAQYDTDRDGFIDEDDDIFDKLKIMCVNDDGSTTLYSLKEKGVGAICLQNAATRFSLNNPSDNSTKGVIRSTGMFLYESGAVGTVQQLDMALKAYA